MTSEATDGGASSVRRSQSNAGEELGDNVRDHAGDRGAAGAARAADAPEGNTMPETQPAARSSADDIGSTGEGATCGPGGCPCFVAGTLIAVAALSGLLSPGVALADGTPYATEADRHGVAIETLDVGMRVSTAQGESETQVDGTWEVYDLELTDGAGRPVMVTLLRPSGWLQERDGDGDGTFWLEVPGMGLRGLARVVSARGPPRLSEGPGRVVLGTFVRSAENVVTLGLAGFGDALLTTANHPFWSLDRQAWVAAGELALGERVQTATGETRLESRERVPGVHPVYNLEVEGDHEYFAGAGFARVHNACEDFTDELARAPESARARLRGELGLSAGDGLEAHHLIPLGERSHALVQRAARAGFDFNGKSNGLGLDFHRHRGVNIFHHNRYNRAIRRRLDYELSINPNITDADASDLLHRYTEQLRNGISRSPSQLR